MCFWESQPGAYDLNRRPCFVYTLIWDDFRIRSLHPPDSETDPRGRPAQDAAEEDVIQDDTVSWIDALRQERRLNNLNFDSEE